MVASPTSTGPELLREASRVVIKFGGDNAGELKKNVALVRALIAGGKQLSLVFSAIRSSSPESARFSLFDPKKDPKNASQFNTTSHLIEMAKAVECGNYAEADRWLTAVERFTMFAVENDLKQNPEEEPDSNLEVQIARLETLIRKECDNMRVYLKEACEVRPLDKPARFIGQGANGAPVDRVFASNGRGRPYVSFTGFGEALAEKIYHRFFEQQDVDAQPLNANEISGLVFGENPREAIEQRSTIVDKVRDLLGEKIKECLSGGASVLISGGRLPGVAESRGYSDVAAVVLAEAMKDSNGGTPLIWIAKQGPIESIDPKLLSDARKRRLAERASLRLADELFDPNGADAGALHTDAAKRLKPGMNVVIGNPEERESRLSWVSADHTFDDEEGVVAVAMASIPQLITVRGGDMVERPGVMDRVLAQYRDVIVGHTHTDASVVNVTLHSVANRELAERLQNLLRELYDRNYQVEVVTGQAWVFCVGNRLGNAAKAMAYTVLDQYGVAPRFEMGSSSCLKFVVPKNGAEDLVRALHEALIEKPATLSA